MYVKKMVNFYELLLDGKHEHGSGNLADIKKKINAKMLKKGTIMVEMAQMKTPRKPSKKPTKKASKKPGKKSKQPTIVQQIEELYN